MSPAWLIPSSVPTSATFLGSVNHWRTSIPQVNDSVGVIVNSRMQSNGFTTPVNGFLFSAGNVSVKTIPETNTCSAERAAAAAKGARSDPVLFIMYEASIGIDMTANPAYDSRLPYAWPLECDDGIRGAHVSRSRLGGQHAGYRTERSLVDC